jgi:signal transduction histidine kinase
MNAMETTADIAVARSDTHAANAAQIEKLDGLVRVYIDLTEKMRLSQSQLKQTVQSLRNELSEKNRLLERKKRLAALGEMAAGMAHEIRNPLGGIDLYASMLARDVQRMPGSLQLVNKISAGVKRLEALVSQVLQFSREMTPQVATTDLPALVDECIELSGDRIGHGIACRAVGPRPMTVDVDPLLMGQAVLNLVINAVEAVCNNGVVEIFWAPAEGEGDGGFRLGVKDTGPGIPPAVLDKIFNPFFTTKESGTGLGLAIVHRIVEAHDGTITAVNGPSGGAVFEIRIG